MKRRGSCYSEKPELAHQSSRDRLNYFINRQECHNANASTLIQVLRGTSGRNGVAASGRIGCITFPRSVTYPVKKACRVLGLLKAVQSIEGRGFIALGEGRIIKDGVHEIGDFAFEEKDGLADV